MASGGVSSNDKKGIGVYISNLHTATTANDIRRCLLSLFPGEKSLLTASITMYTEGIKRSSVVSGIQLDWPTFSANTSNVILRNRHCVFKLDMGQLRNVSGKFVNPQHLIVRKRSYAMHGRYSVMRVLRAAVFDDKVVRIDLERSACFSITGSKDHLLSSILSEGGSFVNKHQLPNGLYLVKYSSVMAALQATLILHGRIIEQTVIRASTKQGTELSSQSFDVGGLSKDGMVLDFGLYPNRVIPLLDLNSKVFDLNKYMTMESRCWKCSSSYTLQGISLNMEFFTGLCQCDYSNAQDIANDYRAIFQKNERFTRLRVAMTPDDKSEMLIPVFTPIPETFHSMHELRSILHPIMEDEKNVCGLQCRSRHSTIGRILKTQFVDNHHRKTKNWRLEIRVPKSFYWCSEGFVRMGSAEIVVDENLNYPKTEGCNLRCNLDSIHEQNHFCFIWCSCKGGFDLTHLSGHECTIFPEPPTLTINKVQKLLKFNQNHFTRNILTMALTGGDLQVIVGKSTSLEQLPFFRDAAELVNAEQMQALRNSYKFSASYLHGPPGTGKSFTAAFIVLLLSKALKEKVLLLVPSHAAATSLIKLIVNVANLLNLQDFTCTRMYSRKRETVMLMTHSEAGLPKPVEALHELIAKDIRFTEDTNGSFCEEMKTYNHFAWTEQEKTFFFARRDKFERDILESSDIIVATLSSLADDRIANWVSTRQTQNLNVVFDEAAYSTLADTVLLLGFPFDRLIFAGDHRQLRRSLSSMSAMEAGFDKSCVEWLLANNSNIPTTMLRVQYRMAEPIMNIVSEIGYEKSLIMGTNPADNELVAVTSRVFDCQSQVFSVPHSGVETSVKSSFVNTTEIQVVIHVCKRLIAGGIKPERMLVIAFYSAQKDQLLYNLDSLGVDVRTVDSSQGSEADVVILSCVRSGVGGKHVGFVAIENRVIVALSRAKHLQFIVHHESFFTSSQNRLLREWSRLLQVNGERLILKDLR